MSDPGSQSVRDPSERVPPGQTLTEKWPVLHYGSTPRVDVARWRFRVFGRVEHPIELTYEQFLALPRTSVTRDIHCVTTWSRFDNTFEGIPFREILRLAPPMPNARYVMVHAEYGFTTNVPLDDLDRDDVLFALRHNGQDLTPDHGWPVRLVVPHLYFWKSAKWVRGIEFLDQDRPGFWERNGYHMRGDPWREERYG
ncbi:MAG: sulfite oxidase-like oxidoreductase [Chloroflexota bacterium]|nr:MAG: sulfite oxidase-like oxidoreductase [Chloroflexota bacterium]